MNVGILVAASVLGAGPLQIPDGYQGARWGMTVAEVRKVFPTLSPESRNGALVAGGLNAEWSDFQLEVAGHPARASCGFMSGALVAVGLKFENEQFRKILKKHKSGDDGRLDAFLEYVEEFPNGSPLVLEFVALLTRKYGPPTEASEGGARWEGDRTRVQVSDLHDLVVISYTDAISLSKIEDRKRLEEEELLQRKLKSL